LELFIIIGDFSQNLLDRGLSLRLWPIGVLL
jgi:hypothetical protein